jgi:hypothetical protein
VKKGGFSATVARIEMRHRELYFHSINSDRNGMLDRLGMAWSRKILFNKSRDIFAELSGTAWTVSRTPTAAQFIASREELYQPRSKFARYYLQNF